MAVRSAKMLAPAEQPLESRSLAAFVAASLSVKDAGFLPSSCGNERLFLAASTPASTDGGASSSSAVDDSSSDSEASDDWIGESFGRPENHNMLGAPSGSGPELVLDLAGLLASQTSVAESVQACRQDVAYADRFEGIALKARTLFQSAASVIRSYVNVAEQICGYILPDVKLAVEENEPELVEAMMLMLRQWVDQAKQDTDSVCKRYSELSQLVHTVTGMRSIKQPEALATHPRAMEGKLESAGVLDGVFLAAGPAVVPLGMQFSREQTKDTCNELDAVAALLRDVDDVITNFEACSTFWTKMDGVMEELTSPGGCARCLALHDAKRSATEWRPQLQSQFLAYYDFWESVAHLCKRYCKEHQLMFKNVG